MQSWITQFVEQYGYLSIFLLVTLENVFPPIPSEVILTFGGFMTTYSNLTIPFVIAFATAGSVAGAVILYAIGRLLDVKRLERIVQRWGYLLRVKVEDIHRADAWFKRYGYWTVFFCRMIPIIRSLISIPAGMSGLRMGVFVLLTTLGTLLWNILLVIAGALLGANWERILDIIDTYQNITILVIVIAFAAFVVFWFLKTKGSKGKASKK